MTPTLPIYLDYHATTPVDPAVFETMRPYFSDNFGNPASSSHSFGWRAEEAVKRAREQVAKLINAADPKEIIWTSGTTESINMALKGIAVTHKERGNHLITCVTEHRATLGVMEYLEKNGYKVTYLPVKSDGQIALDQLERSMTGKTILISLLAAHNEIGVLYPLKEIGTIAHNHKVLFHVDGAQACGKIPLDVQGMKIDLLSMSAHKLYGPKGIGALYVRKRAPTVELLPLIHGGSQESGLRAGTLAVPNIVGMGKAFEIAQNIMEQEAPRLKQLRNRLYQGFCERLGEIPINGDSINRLPGNLNVSFSGVRSDAIMAKLHDIAVSSGSACSSGSLEPSYVIRSLGVGEERARSSIRFGLGRFSTEEEINYTIERMTDVIHQLKS